MLDETFSPNENNPEIEMWRSAATQVLVVVSFIADSFGFFAAHKIDVEHLANISKNLLKIRIVVSFIPSPVSISKHTVMHNPWKEAVSLHNI